MTTLCPTDFCPIEIININVVNAPLVKDYYWKSLNIARLNKILLQLRRNEPQTCQLGIPSMPVNSSPIKIVIHMLNPEPTATNWSLKRTQLCECKIVQKAVGINNFRTVYDCPHRELLTILPTSGEVKAREKFSFTLYISYGYVGESMLGYEFVVNNDFKLNLRIAFDVYEFDPCKCVLTKSLFPTCLARKGAIRPIWMYNPFKHELKLRIWTHNSMLRIIEGNVKISSGATYPILVQFSSNQLGDYELIVFLEFMGIEKSFVVKASAINMYMPLPAHHSPKIDFPCPEAPFTIYKCYLPVVLDIRAMISKMVILHNKSTACMQYRWISPSLKGYYSMHVTPSSGTIKPNHGASCVIKFTVGSIQCVFDDIPIFCDIYEFTGTKMVENDECSFDSSLDERDTTNKLITRLSLNVGLRVEGLHSLDIPMYPPENALADIELLKKNFLSGRFDRDVFDKIVWNMVYNEDFLNDVMRKKCDKTYDESLRGDEDESPPARRFHKRIFVEVLEKLTLRAIKQLADNWRFIPEEYGKGSL